MTGIKDIWNQLTPDTGKGIKVDDMTKNLEQVLADLSPQRKAKIEERAAELATLRSLRHAMRLTQKDLAAALHIGQEGVSRLEKRSDMLLSTLRGYVMAMGGELELVARFPDRPPVVIEHLADKPTTPVRKRDKKAGENPLLNKI